MRLRMIGEALVVVLVTTGIALAGVGLGVAVFAAVGLTVSAILFEAGARRRPPAPPSPEVIARQRQIARVTAACQVLWLACLIALNWVHPLVWVWPFIAFAFIVLLIRVHRVRR